MGEWKITSDHRLLSAKEQMSPNWASHLAFHGSFLLSTSYCPVQRCPAYLLSSLFHNRLSSLPEVKDLTDALKESFKYHWGDQPEHLGSFNTPCPRVIVIEPPFSLKNV